MNRRGVFAIALAVALGGIFASGNAQTKSDKWDQIFHGASATPTASQKPEPPPVIGEAELMKDSGDQLRWVASPLQLARLQSWKPEQDNPPVSLPDLCKRVKAYADKSFPERGWLIWSFDMLPVPKADGTKWFFLFSLNRPFILPEGESYVSTADVPPNRHFEQNADVRSKTVVVLHDGTIIEPRETKK